MSAFLLKEDGGYLLKEDGGKIILEQSFPIDTKRYELTSRKKEYNLKTKERDNILDNLFESRIMRSLQTKRMTKIEEKIYNINTKNKNHTFKSKRKVKDLSNIEKMEYGLLTKKEIRNLSNNEKIRILGKLNNKYNL